MLMVGRPADGWRLHKSAEGMRPPDLGERELLAKEKLRVADCYSWEIGDVVESGGEIGASVQMLASCASARGGLYSGGLTVCGRRRRRPPYILAHFWRMSVVVSKLRVVWAFANAYSCRLVAKAHISLAEPEVVPHLTAYLVYRCKERKWNSEKSFFAPTTEVWSRKAVFLRVGLVERRWAT
jgi:hypothetical protein